MTAREELEKAAQTLNIGIDDCPEYDRFVKLTTALVIIDRREAKLRKLVESMEDSKVEMKKLGTIMDDWIDATASWQRQLEAVLKEE